MKSYLKGKGIRMKPKLPFAERVIRILKVAMYRYFTYKQTSHYLDMLQDLVDGYIHGPHRSLNQRSPSEPTEAAVLKDEYIDPFNTKSTPTKTLLEIMSELLTCDAPFNEVIKNGGLKKYLSSTEDVSCRDGFSVYQMKDMTRDSIEGRFYEN